MLKTYKYILKLYHVENGKYSIVHLLSPTCTHLDSLKGRGKNIVIFKKSIWMHIKYG